MADHVRDEFLAWMAGSATLPTRPSRTRVFDRLADDRSRLPASLRFRLTGCDSITVAHAARLLRRLDAQGMLEGHDSVCEALRAVPTCILHDTVRIVDESLRAESAAGSESTSDEVVEVGGGATPRTPS